MQETPHHGDRWFKEAAEQAQTRETIDALAHAIGRHTKLGETGAFPLGALTPDDEGEIRFAVTAQAGKVVLAFGKAVAWVGMPPRAARQLADALNDWADKA